MPIKQAAIKALRQSNRRASRNTKVKSDVDALVRKVRKAIEKRDASIAKRWLLEAIKKIDRAVQHRVIKKNAAARTKSRLSVAINKLSK